MTDPSALLLLLCLSVFLILYGLVGLWAFFTALTSAHETGLGPLLGTLFAVFCALFWPLLILSGMRRKQ